MALSGNKYTAFARHRLVLEWSATQNIAGNYSDVTAWLYLQSMDQWGTLYASAQGTAQVTANGVQQTEQATSQLSAYQKKLLLAKTWRVNHDANGAKSFTMSASYFVNVTYTDGGVSTYYGTISIPGFTITLNTIPRHSSLNAVPTFTLPGASSFSIVRQSSSFTHTCEFWIAKVASPTIDNDAHWEKIKTLNNIATSGSFTFTTAEVSKMISYRGGNASWQGKIKIFTNGLSGLSSQRYMWINNPPTAIPSMSPTNFTIKAGQVLTFSLSGYNSNTLYSYNHEVGFGGYVIRITDVKTATFTYTLTQTDVDNMLLKIPNAKSGGCSIAYRTYYNGTAIGNTSNTGTIYTGTVDEATAKPSTSGTPTYKDTNTGSVNLTGSNQTVLQGKSTVDVVIPANFGSAVGGATIKTVLVSLGGVSKTVNYSATAQTVSVGTPTASSNTNLIVTITDSRGLQASYAKVVTVYPYTEPDVSFTLARKNNFQTETDLVVNSTWSPVTVGGVNKNAISDVSYAVKKDGDVSFGSSVSIPFTISGSRVVVNLLTIDLSNDYGWQFRLTITDKFGMYINYSSVSSGKPIMFLDAKSQIARFGDLQGSSVTGRVPGLVELEPGRTLGSGKTGIQMNFSDISGVNELQFDVGITSNTLQVLGGNLMINQSMVFNHYPGQTTFNSPVAFYQGIASIEIYANDNLNNYTKPGFYFCPQTATATTVSNTPENVAFSLFVEQHAGTKQTFTTYFAGAPKSYIRNYYNGTWGSWQRGGDIGLTWTVANRPLGFSTTGNIVRMGNTVTIYVGRQARNWSSTNENTALSETIPTGYRPTQEATLLLTRNSSTSYFPPVTIHIATGGSMRYTNPQAVNAVCVGTVTYTTSDPYP